MNEALSRDQQQLGDFRVSGVMVRLEVTSRPSIMTDATAIPKYFTAILSQASATNHSGSI